MYTLRLCPINYIPENSSCVSETVATVAVNVAVTESYLMLNQ